MNLYFLYVIALFVFGQISRAHTNSECLNGDKDPTICCVNVTESQDVLLRNRDNCNSYYQCVHQQPILRNCPQNLHWSVSSNRCELPENAECSSAESICPEQPSRECILGLIAPDNCCKNYPNWMNIILKIKGDCNSYFICVDGRPQLEHCPKGLKFNVEKRRCDWNGSEDCEQYNSTTTTPITSTPSSETDTSTRTTPYITTTEKPLQTTCKPPGEEKPSEDCANGVTNPEICCKGVPYWIDVLLKNPEDCGTYYQCVHEKPVLRPCPAGLHWSVKSNRCEWPELAQCITEVTSTSSPWTTPSSVTSDKPLGTTCKPPGEEKPSEDCANGVINPEICCKGVPYWIDVLLKNLEDCGTYYQCVHEKPVLRPCPAGLHWSVKSNRCEWPELAQCITNVISTASPIRTTPSGVTSDKPIRTTCKPPGEEKPSEDCANGVINPEICCKGVPYWIDVLLKNPEDCGTYYQCVHEKPVLRPCPAGLHWSVKSNRCEWPELAQCITEVTSTSSPWTTPSSVTSDKPLGTTCKPPGEEKPSEDCANGVINPEICCKGVPYWIDVLLKNPEDCGTYYQCVHEKPVLRPCPAGLHWSVKSNRCEWPELAQCITEVTSTSSPIRTTPSGVTSDKPIGTTCKPPGEEKPSEDCANGVTNPEICCKGVPYWIDVLLRNPEDCGTYYQCVHEKPVLRPCPAGLHWSVKSNRCEWPELAQCITNVTSTASPIRTTPSGVTSDKPIGTTCKPPGEEKPSEDCANGVTNPEICCKGVPYWIDVLLRNPEDCGTYYQCVHEKPVLRPCPAGLHWSVKSNRCDWPELAQCITEVTSTSSPIRTTPSGVTSDKPIGTTCKPPGEEKPSEDCANGVTNPEICCKGVPYWIDVLLRNPEDCGTYYQCVHEKPVLRPCPAGLHWSVKSNRCEWPELAQCITEVTSTAGPWTTPSSVTSDKPLGTTCKPPGEEKPSEDCANGVTNPEICCKGVPYWIDVLLRNPEDCGTYYQCVHEKPVLRPCPAGLHWSVKSNRCEWPELAQCTTNATSTASPIRTTPSGVTSDKPIGTTCKPPGEEKPSEDCINGATSPEICCIGIPYWTDVLLKNPEDCGTYYQCVHEKPVLRPCPAGLHWSTVKNRCEWPKNAQCEVLTNNLVNPNKRGFFYLQNVHSNNIFKTSK